MNPFLLIQMVTATVTPMIHSYNCENGYPTAQEYEEHCKPVLDSNGIVLRYEEIQPSVAE